MKSPRLFAGVGILAALFVFSAVSASAETLRYAASPRGSKVKIEGTSTVHDWTVESAIIGGAMELESNFPLDPAQAGGDVKVTPKVQVKIPVSSIKSGKALMDDVMHDAMKIKDFSQIEYTLDEMKAKNPERKAGDPLEFNTKGQLTVAGVKKPIDMVVSMVPQGDKLKVVGSKNLKMTDFGIKPPAPSLGLGLIKTSDDVKITFEWLTVRKDDKKTASAQ
jgi:polyisoprenoid-binding protein YceI